MPWFIMITYAFVLKSFVAKIVKVILADFVSTGFFGSVTWVSFTTMGKKLLVLTKTQLSHA